MPDLFAVPQPLIDLHSRFGGDKGRVWVDSLPTLADTLMRQWDLRREDDRMYHGMVSLVLPVVRADGTPAALKLGPLDHETEGEPVALRVWAGDGTVRLLEFDPDSGGMLLERLDARRPLSTVEDDLAALRTLAEIMARLVVVPAPPQLRRLADIAAGMLADVPHAQISVGEADRHVLSYCAAAVAELIGEPGDRLLHWDLHYDNILAGEREPWLAIDPKPLAGDPCFELLPALRNRWDDVVATGDIRRAVRRRFDLMVDVVGLERERAVGWTLGRVLQNCLWNIADGDAELNPIDVAIARALSGPSTSD